MSSLSDRDQQILDLEAQHWRYSGTKEAAIGRQLAMTATRYYQRLNALLDDPAAVAYAPIVVNRLRRIRAAR